MDALWHGVALFDPLSEVKILTSQLAMDLDREWRDKLFQLVDSLHDQHWFELVEQNHQPAR